MAYIRTAAGAPSALPGELPRRRRQQQPPQGSPARLQLHAGHPPLRAAAPPAGQWWGTRTVRLPVPLARRPPLQPERGVYQRSRPVAARDSLFCFWLHFPPAWGRPWGHYNRRRRPPPDAAPPHPPGCSSTASFPACKPCRQGGERGRGRRRWRVRGGTARRAGQPLARASCRRGGLWPSSVTHWPRKRADETVAGALGTQQRPQRARRLIHARSCR